MPTNPPLNQLGVDFPAGSSLQLLTEDGSIRAAVVAAPTPAGSGVDAQTFTNGTAIPAGPNAVYTTPPIAPKGTGKFVVIGAVSPLASIIGNVTAALFADGTVRASAGGRSAAGAAQTGPLVIIDVITVDPATAHTFGVGATAALGTVAIPLGQARLTVLELL